MRRVKAFLLQQPKVLSGALLVLSAGSALAGAVWQWASPGAWILASALAVLAILAAMQHVSRLAWGLFAELQRTREDTVKLVAAECHAAMTLMRRFPEMTFPTSGYSMRFVNLLRIIDMLDQGPLTRVVELGSGISTLCIAAWMKRNTRGKITSFDHDAEWAEVTRRQIHQAGLEAFAEVVVAPLREWNGDGRRRKWYGLESYLSDLKPVDLLIVDGPPNRTDSRGMARLPALYVFAEYLNEDAIVVLDDAQRPSEQAVIEAWCGAFPRFIPRSYSSATGMCVLRQASPAADQRNGSSVPGA